MTSITVLVSPSHSHSFTIKVELTPQAYDYLTSLSDEVTYVWPSKWNTGKTLYFLLRYSVFIDIFLVKALNLAPLPVRWCQILLFAEECMYFRPFLSFMADI